MGTEFDASGRTLGFAGTEVKADTKQRRYLADGRDRPVEAFHLQSDSGPSRSLLASIGLIASLEVQTICALQLEAAQPIVLKN